MTVVFRSLCAAVRPVALAAVLGTALSLAGCGGEDRVAATAQDDPAMIAAIEAPIMTDPDLSQMNARYAALTPGGPADGSLPMFDLSEDERQTARAEALVLAGGRLRTPPAARKGDGRVAAMAADLSLAGRVQRITGRTDCLRGAAQGMIWGARLPARLPAYPRAHLRVALGSAAKDCGLVAAGFMAGIPASDALGFYATMASRAGLSTALAQDGDAWLLEGRGKDGDARFGVLVRPGPVGTTLIDVVTLNL